MPLPLVAGLAPGETLGGGPRTSEPLELTSKVLAEAGPGRGTLMQDALRATAKIPGFHTAMKLYLIESSETLRAKLSRHARLPEPPPGNAVKRPPDAKQVQHPHTPAEGGLCP